MKPPQDDTGLDLIVDLIHQRPRTFVALWDEIARRTNTTDALAKARLGDEVRDALSHLVRERRLKVWSAGQAPIFCSNTMHKKACAASSYASKPIRDAAKKERRKQEADRKDRRARRAQLKANAAAAEAVRPSTRKVIRR